MLTALDKAPPPITSHRAMVQERWIKEAAEAASYQGVCAAFAIKIGVRLLHPQNAERGRAQSQERMASIAWADQDRGANGDEESYQQPSDHVRLQQWS